MGTTAAHYFRAVLYRLRRNPVLTAMMLYSVVLGMTALMAAFAVWRASSGCPMRQRSEPLYVVQIHKGESPWANYC
jgi:putative ABC transport system permease protein